MNSIFQYISIVNDNQHNNNTIIGIRVIIRLIYSRININHFLPDGVLWSYNRLHIIKFCKWPHDMAFLREEPKMNMKQYEYIYIYTVPHNHPNSGGWSLIFCQVISARVGWVYNPLHCRRWLGDSYRIASIQSAGAVLSLWHRHISLGLRASAMWVAWWHDGNWGSRPICGKSGAVGRSLADNAGPSNQYTSRTFKSGGWTWSFFAGYLLVHTSLGWQNVCKR